jgi:hypothetical protein
LNFSLLIKSQMQKRQDMGTPNRIDGVFHHNVWDLVHCVTREIHKLTNFINSYSFKKIRINT